MSQPRLQLVSANPSHKDCRFTLALPNAPDEEFDTLDALAARVVDLTACAQLYVVGAAVARGEDQLAGAAVALRFIGRRVTPPAVPGLAAAEERHDETFGYALVRPATSDASRRLSNALDLARSNWRAASQLRRVGA